RYVDLQTLEGHQSILCFLWDNQEEPLLIPYVEFEEVFNSIKPANDGQYKVVLYDNIEAKELYIANAGRFNVESYIGWSVIDNLIDTSTKTIPTLSHSQVQTLIGAIGSKKGYSVWLPPSDRSNLDWSLTNKFSCESQLPYSLREIKNIVEEIDVIWLEHGKGTAKAFFEVEHSTPIYSGLLRFNDVHLLSPDATVKFSIISNDARRSLFVRQLNRPTFQTSGLSKICNFLEYRNVYTWYHNVC
ncbi:hypothetical protein MYX76_18020, partial [Desulfobacterota bacterium AH_259_B03_O07]|nr:hypothetical protein [Desulfobacterota bacterium AH_259_B03_O07]